MTWTTWGRWTDLQPETEVLTSDTGHLRAYGSDDYGSYNPRRGYYDSDDIVYELLHEDDRLHPKRVVVASRTDDGETGGANTTSDRESDGTFAVVKDHLREEGVVETNVGETPYVAVYDPDLDAGYVYRNPEDRTVTYDDGPILDGEAHGLDALPLERVIGFDAMWFAWVAFYPGTALAAERTRE